MLIKKSTFHQNQQKAKFNGEEKASILYKLQQHKHDTFTLSTTMYWLSITMYCQKGCFKLANDERLPKTIV